MSLSIDQTAGVAGFVQPGDEVNILVQVQGVGCNTTAEEDEDGTEADSPAAFVSEEEIEAAAVAEANCGMYTNPARALFQRVEVLSVGANLQLAPGETSQTGITQIGGPMTFMVPSEAAQLLASIDETDIYLTLLPEDYQAEPMPPLTPDLLAGPTPAELAECLTPYGADGFIAGDAIDDSETVADGDEQTDEPSVQQFSCAALWEN